MPHTLQEGDDDSLSQPATPPTDPNDVSNFDLCAPIKALLADKGITSLFDIQARAATAHAPRYAALQGFICVGPVGPV